MIHGFFITGTGTDVGKTVVARALAIALRRRVSRPVTGIKPLETGCDPHPRDALALAHAAGSPHCVSHPDFLRARPPVSPYAAALAGEPGVPPTASLVRAIEQLTPPAGVAIVEGPGGLLVPLDRRRSVADLARALRLPLILVAPNALGVLSSSLTCLESARARDLRVLAVVLNTPRHLVSDASLPSNHQILAELAGCPVLAFPHCTDDDNALFDAAITSGLFDLAVEQLSAGA